MLRVPAFGALVFVCRLGLSAPGAQTIGYRVVAARPLHARRGCEMVVPMGRWLDALDGTKDEVQPGTLVLVLGRSDVQS